MFLDKVRRFLYIHIQTWKDYTLEEKYFFYFRLGIVYFLLS